MSTINLSNKIRQYRLKNKWSQRELSSRSGVPFKTLIKIEYNTSKEPTIQTVYKIARAFKVPIEKLIDIKQ